MQINTENNALYNHWRVVSIATRFSFLNGVKRSMIPEFIETNRLYVLSDYQKKGFITKLMDDIHFLNEFKQEYKDEIIQPGNLISLPNGKTLLVNTITGELTDPMNNNPIFEEFLLLAVLPNKREVIVMKKTSLLRQSQNIPYIMEV